MLKIYFIIGAIVFVINLIINAIILYYDRTYYYTTHMYRQLDVLSDPLSTSDKKKIARRWMIFDAIITVIICVVMWFALWPLTVIINTILICNNTLADKIEDFLNN